MGVNIKKCSDIYTRFKYIYEEKKDYLNIELKVHKILMCFFLMGYLLIAVGIISDHMVIGLITVGLILFFGSIFVFIGIGIQSKMITLIHETYLQTIKALISVIECRDAYTCGHSEHVANLSTLICSKLSKECENKNMIQIAALLHDIGKIGISENILNKPDKLTVEEFNIMKSHPRIGKNIIENINGLGELSNYILYHHERVDGGGYYKLTKENIPMEARIIAIADAFSALVTKRPYKNAMKYKEAMEIMKKSAGSQFDEEILEVFLNIPIDELKSCMPKRLC